MARRTDNDVSVPDPLASKLHAELVAEGGRYYLEDRGSRNGTYLAGLVLYATITRDDPRRSTWRPHRVSRRVAAELRDVAYQAVFALP